MARNDPTKEGLQHLFNRSYDPEAERMAFIPVEVDGSATPTRAVSKLTAKKVVISGNYTYTAIAAPGTDESAALWQAKRVENVSGAGTTFITTWADGNTNFDNVATDLTALSYS